MRLLACAAAALGVFLPALVVGPLDDALPALLGALPATAAFAGLGGRSRRGGVVRRGQAKDQAAEDDGKDLAERHGAVGGEQGGGKG